MADDRMDLHIVFDAQPLSFSENHTLLQYIDISGRKKKNNN